MGNSCTHGRHHDEYLPEDHANVFEAYLEERNKHIPQTGKIKVLSFNIFIRPPGIHNNQNDYKDERLQEFVKRIHSFDVICLQEMFGSYSSRRSQFIKKAKETGFIHNVASPRHSTMSGQWCDGGLLTLSRYPIIATEFCPYSLGIGSDYYVQKGVLYTMIRIGNSRLHLYNTHTQAGYDDSVKWFCKRTEQITSFRHFLKNTLTKHRYRSDDIVLISGDFNVDGRSSRRYHLKKRTMSTIFESITSLMEKDSFSEYEALVANLSDNGKNELEDLLHKKYGESPVTYGDCLVEDNNIIPVDMVLTHKQSLCTRESLDYIFRYVPKDIMPEWPGPNTAKLNQEQRLFQQSVQKPQKVVQPGTDNEMKPLAKPGLSVIYDSATVEKFEVKGRPFNILSDHYGVSVTLEYVRSNVYEKPDSDVTTLASSYPYLSPEKDEEIMQTEPTGNIDMSQMNMENLDVTDRKLDLDAADAPTLVNV